MATGNERPDDELMRAFQNGEVDAFEALFERYRSPLSAFALGSTGEPATAEDVAQETFIRVYEQHKEYVPTGHFRAWIYTIARNLCCDRFREPVLVGLDLDIPLVLWSGHRRSEETARWKEKTEHSERMGRLGQGVDQLPPPMREVVTLKYYHGLKAREIAEVQDCPVGTVKSRLHYALKRLGEIISD